MGRAEIVLLSAKLPAVFIVGGAQWEGKSVRCGRGREERHVAEVSFDDICSEVRRYAVVFFTVGLCMLATLLEAAGS